MTFLRLSDGARSYSVVERRDGVRYRVYDGTATSRLPHDLGHLIVERETGDHGGFWGAVAAGVVFSSMEHLDGRRPPHARERSEAAMRERSDGLRRAELMVWLTERVARERRHGTAARPRDGGGGAVVVPRGTGRHRAGAGGGARATGGRGALGGAVARRRVGRGVARAAVRSGRRLTPAGGNPGGALRERVADRTSALERGSGWSRIVRAFLRLLTVLLPAHGREVQLRVRRLRAPVPARSARSSLRDSGEGRW